MCYSFVCFVCPISLIYACTWYPHRHFFKRTPFTIYHRVITIWNASGLFSTFARLIEWRIWITHGTGPQKYGKKSRTASGGRFESFFVIILQNPNKLPNFPTMSQADENTPVQFLFRWILKQNFNNNVSKKFKLYSKVTFQCDICHPIAQRQRRLRRWEVPNMQDCIWLCPDLCR